MLRRKISRILAIAALVSASLSAQGSDQLLQLLGLKNQGHSRPIITVERDFLAAEAGQTENLSTLVLTIQDQAGYTVFSERSAGEPIAMFVSNLGLADGKYRYSVRSVYETSAPAAAEPWPSYWSRNAASSS